MREELNECVIYDDAHMGAALREAEAALLSGEVPVGCVFVDAATNEILSSGHNETNAQHNALEHAELVAWRRFPTHRRHVAVLYVTVEPCIMCASFLRFSGVRAVFFGCANDRFGGTGTVLSMHLRDAVPRPLVGHIPGEVSHTLPFEGYCCSGGKRADEAVALLQKFYEQENEAAPVSKRRRKDL